MYKIISTAIFLAFLSGCSMNAVQFQPDFDLVNELKDKDISKLVVGDITSTDPKVDQVSLRGSPMISPYNKSYADYLEVALKEQLVQANLYDKASTIEIRGELLENSVSAAGISTGTADLSARFEVRSNGDITFDKVKTIKHEWESSFVGAIAIPNAQNNYPVAVQKLILALMSDPDFIKAAK
ncbi:MAG: hypothetical protein V7739_15210 [Motiliproteus sp.]